MLVPCPQCQKNYCAAHRFHGHEEEASATKAHRSKRQSGLTSSEMALEGVLGCCAPYKAASPLVLAPLGHMNHLMPLLAILTTPFRTATTSSGTDNNFVYGLCNLSVAAEATIGQMLQRCLYLLGFAGPQATMESDALLALTRTAAVYDISATASAHSTGLAVNLTPLPAARITKDVLLPTAPVVMAFGAQATVSPPQPPLEASLTALLFSPHPEGVALDDRLRAVSARLRLHGSRKATASLSAPESATSAPLEEPTSTTEEVLKANTEAPSPAQTGCTTATDAVALTWPLRSPPPLTSHKGLVGSKGMPLGLGAVPAGQRVTIAVLIEDINLPATAPVCCVAVGRGWPAGKVVQVVQEQVAAAARLPIDTIANAVPHLYVLGRVADAASTDILSVKGAHGLKDGDVVYLGAAHSGRLHPLVQVEVDRLRALKGKEQMALKMTMMQQCTML